VKKFIGIVLVATLAPTTISVSHAEPYQPLAPPPKPIIECPNSNVHVWDRDQCDEFILGENRGHGGSRCRGLLCGIGGILGLGSLGIL
jgi:hypothetical protein